MTREQFVNGTSFRLPNKVLRGDNTYSFRDNMIIQEVRTKKGRVLFTQHEANVDKIGRVGFEAYNYVMDKRVVVKFRFEDLEEVI